MFGRSGIRSRRFRFEPVVFRVFSTGLLVVVGASVLLAPSAGFVPESYVSYIRSKQRQFALTFDNHYGQVFLLSSFRTTFVIATLVARTNVAIDNFV
jgi:hypothetical protein